MAQIEESLDSAHFVPYGLTETSPGVASNPLNIVERACTIGMPFPSTQLAVLDERGKELSLGEVGEIAVRGPQVMAGYWNRPDERSGEIVKIVVVRNAPTLTEQDLPMHCRKHLAAYKVPKIVEFRSEPLPKSSLGKILRRQLREAAYLE